jgi:hypothetical protein
MVDSQVEVEVERLWSIEKASKTAQRQRQLVERAAGAAQEPVAHYHLQEPLESAPPLEMGASP